jgi:hypothetical protein
MKLLLQKTAVLGGGNNFLNILTRLFRGSYINSQVHEGIIKFS